MFDGFIGIDYSGAKEPAASLTGLRAYYADADRPPVEMRHPGGGHWSRLSLYVWLAGQVALGKPLLIGLDHGFSFPKIYFLRHQLKSWPKFLDHFVQTMPTHELSVETLRQQRRLLSEAGNHLRLCEAWTASAKSVFQFDMQGSVAKSTYAGLPWLHTLREQFGSKLFFWPFDGETPPQGVSVICEIYPALYKRRYRRGDMGLDAFDAYSTVRWMQDMQRRDALSGYFSPPLNAEEWALARLEGWILGVR